MAVTTVLLRKMLLQQHLPGVVARELEIFLAQASIGTAQVSTAVMVLDLAHQ